MTERFRWGDEETPIEKPSSERQPATEQDYDKYMSNKMNSAKMFEKLRLLTDVAERDNVKAQGLPLQYYRTGNEIYWSTTLKN